MHSFIHCDIIISRNDVYVNSNRQLSHSIIQLIKVARRLSPKSAFILSHATTKIVSMLFDFVFRLFFCLQFRFKSPNSLHKWKCNLEPGAVFICCRVTRKKVLKAPNPSEKIKCQLGRLLGRFSEIGKLWWLLEIISVKVFNRLDAAPKSIVVNLFNVDQLSGNPQVTFSLNF